MKKRRGITRENRRHRHRIFDLHSSVRAQPLRIGFTVGLTPKDIRIHSRHLRRALVGPFATPLQLKSSYSYQWDELDVRTFRSEGVIARRTPEGEPRFNFPQTIWLFPQVQMDWAHHANRAVQTLAVNILTPFLPQRDMAAYFGTMSRRAFDAALPFAEDFLLNMPPGGGRIPREIIERWIAEE